MRRLLPLLLLVAACSPGSEGPAAAVSAEQAREAVRGLVELAAQRTPEAMRELCERHDCTGLSSGIAAQPQRAPGPDQAPRERCVVALPPTPSQQGARVVVLEGERGDGRPYLTHVLVERKGDRLEVAEPGFWIGIRYSALQGGRAWSGEPDDEAGRARFRELAERACTDTADWLGEVTGA